VTQSAKRYGLDAQDPELENRIRRIEVALAALGPQTASSSPATTSRGGGTPGQITGLTLSGTNPGTFTFGWSAATISDLRKYEVQIAEDIGFTTGVQNKIAALNEYAFTTGDTSVTRTYYVRVRAVNTADTPGSYSAILNTTTGQVTTEDILDEAVTDPKLETNAVASGRVLGFLAGGILSNGTDTDNDIDISKYAARDAADSLTITGNAITKKMDEVWDSGTNFGGLPSALFPVTFVKWYHVFVISNADGTTVDAGFDTSLTASNLLSDSGLTLYRRVGSVYVNAGGTVDQFYQVGDSVFWDVMVNAWTVSGGGTGRATHTVRTPLGLETVAMMTIGLADNNGKNVALLITNPDQTDTSPQTSSAAHIRVNADGSDNDNAWSTVFVKTNSSSEISRRISSSQGSTTSYGITQGWIDRRGQDG
jgi:hypothetical protein